MKSLLTRRPSRLFCFLVFIQAVALSLAIPVEKDQLSTILNRGSATCENIPGIAAGSNPVGSDGSNEAATLAAYGGLHRRMNPVRWCSHNSATYIVLSAGRALTRAITYPTLAEAYDIVTEHISKVGDGTLLGGAFSFELQECALISIWNANNHQTTWGVLRKTLVALADYLEVSGYTEVTFNIYDGKNQVGSGRLGY